MATSDSRDFKQQRDDLIKTAFQTINVYETNASIRDDDMQYAVSILNMIIKAWQAYDLFLWNKQVGYLFPDLNTAKYDLGLTGDNWTKSYINTKIDGAVTSGSSTITVDSTTGMTANDNIGIKLDDGTRQWTTISSVDSSTDLTLAASVNSAVDDDASVITYTSKADRPLRILGARYDDISQTTQTEVFLEGLGYQKYFDLTAKETDSQPSSYMYDKKFPNGVFYLWPRPSDVDFVININFYEVVEDVDSATDDFDLPAEWQLPLMLNLASMLCFRYAKMGEREQLLPEAKEAFERLRWYNSSDVSLKFDYKSSIGGGDC